MGNTTRGLKSVRTESKQGGASRWQRRKSLDLTPFQDTTNVLLPMGKLPVERTWKPAEQLFHPKGAKSHIETGRDAISPKTPPPAG